MDRPGVGPRIVFPPDGSVVQVAQTGPGARGLALAARGDGLNWYVDGQPLAADPVSGKVIWRPGTAGFYRLSVVDADGKAARSKVRVKTGG